MKQQKAILELISGFRDSGIKKLYCAPNIPEKKLRNAIKACNASENNEVLVLIDFTAFGSAKETMLKPK